MLKKAWTFFRAAVDPPLADQVLGENTLLELVSKKGLGTAIELALSGLEGWPFDLGNVKPNQEEKAILSLWRFSTAVLYGITTGTAADKRAFLDRFHDFYFRLLVEDGSLAPAAAKKLAILAVKRYPEYETAFAQMRGRPASHSVPEASLAQLVTSHLYGHETNDLLVSSAIGTCIVNHLTSFNAAFDSTEAWATIRGLIP